MTLGFSFLSIIKFGFLVTACRDVAEACRNRKA